MSTATAAPRPSIAGGRGSGVPTGTPAAYNRVSKFKVTRGGVEAEVTRSCGRQEADAVEATEELNLGAPPVQFTDEGQSASNYATKARDNWPEFLAYVASGAVSYAMVWVLDRATRTTEGCDDFLTACRKGGALIVQTATMQVADPNNIHDVHALKQAALQAEYEVAKMSMRQRRAKAQAVKEGKPSGGRRRFGFEPGMTAPREAEAAIVRQVATRFLAGESLYALAQWLNTPGPIGPMGPGSVAVETATTAERVAKGQAPAVWTGPNLRNMLLGPHLAGWRVHGKDERGRAVIAGKGTWQAIIEPETHDHLVALLNNPARRPAGAGTARRWLLSGLMVCDACGGPVRGRPHTARNEPPSYRCATGRHVHRNAAPVDAQVTEAVIARLTRHDATGLFVDDTAADEVIRLREARAALDDRIAAYAAEAATMSPKAYAAATNRLEAEADALDVQLIEAATSARQASRVLAGATGAGAREAWEGSTLARRRALIAELAEVRLVGGRHNTTAKGNVFNPDDVRILWR